MILNKSEEIWKDIEGLEGEYAVSTKGRIKNLKTNRILTGKNRDGYRFVRLKCRNYSIHRLVALAFVPNPNKLPQVNHIDEDKTNNNVSNLAWCSISENVNYSSHKYSCKIKQIDKNGDLIKVWNSFHEIEKELGYSDFPIRKVCKGEQEYSHNFKWEYADTSQQRKFNCPVIVYKGDDYIGTFASAAKASEALGLGYRCVSHCLRGRRASTHGYIFRYLE